MIVAERVHTYDWPKPVDVAFYAVAGHELLSGRRLYSDLFDNRPPGSNLSYAAAEIIAGFGSRQVFLLGVTTAIVTLFAVYSAASAAGGTVAAGLWAAAVWTAACGDLALGAHQTNTEMFLNATLTSALAVMLRTTAASRARSFAAGSWFAAASLYKPFVLVNALLACGSHLALPPRGESRRAAFGDVVRIGAVVAAVWLLLVAYFAATGRLVPLYEAIIRFNLFYAGHNSRASGGMMANLLAGTDPERAWPEFLWFATPLLVLTLVSTILGLCLDSRRGALIAASLLATALDVALPGRFYQHYYQLWLPPLAVGTGWALGRLTAERRRGLRPLAALVGAIVLGALLRHELPFYTLPAEHWWREYKGRYNGSAGDVERIDSLLAPEETFYQWGNEVGLYYLSRRRPPTGVLWLSDMQSGPLAVELSERVIAALEREKPKLVIASKWGMNGAGPHQSVLAWCAKHYRQLEGGDGRDPFLWLVRDDETPARGAAWSGRSKAELRERAPEVLLVPGNQPLEP